MDFVMVPMLLSILWIMWRLEDKMDKFLENKGEDNGDGL